MPILLEYQAKELMRRNKIHVPEGKLVTHSAEAIQAAEQLSYPLAIKAQIKMGGRGKAGAIKFASTAEELQTAVNSLIGAEFKNLKVEKVLLEQKLDRFSQELYVSIFSDPASRKPKIIFTRQGGVEVERYLETGENVVKEEVNILEGLKDYQARYICGKAGLSQEEIPIVSKTLLQLYDFYRYADCNLLEVNPLVIREGNAYALDAKVSIDDDSVSRHHDWGFLELDSGEEVGDRISTELEKIAGTIDEGDHRGSAHFVQIDPDGKMAEESGKIPIGFDGVGTGASLITMDELMDLGFSPVNFCDTSGNPTASKLYRVTKVILAQRGIKGYVFVSCLSSQQLDNTARGIVKAFKEVFEESGGHPNIPCVFSFRGAWDEVAYKIFEEHGLLNSPLIRVLGRDSTERSIAAAFSELYHLFAKEGGQ